jgi:hypothetical protein
MPAAAAGRQEVARDPTHRRVVQLFGQSIGAQLFSQSITIGVQLFSQSSTRNLHRACINLGTGSRAQSGSIQIIRERLLVIRWTMPHKASSFLCRFSSKR